MNQLLANPANQVLLSEMNAGDLLTSAQLASVTNLLTTIEDDPAVELLEQKGSELQKDPSELTSDIAALNDAPTELASSPPSTEDPTFDTAASTLTQAPSYHLTRFYRSCCHRIMTRSCRRKSGRNLRS